MIKLIDVCKSYNGTDKVVDHLNLEIKQGELVVLVGESGCGKTTTMRMINRLEEPTSGTILVGDKDISQINPIELRRNIGYVIQKIGLFPHLTVGQNIGIVPRLTKKDPEEIAKNTIRLLEMIDLAPDEYINRYPNEMSGGQQQRIGVARALANDPDIVLMDEPFSALDPITKDQLQNELLKLQEELHKTIVFVTHDIDEAIKIGDRIAVMKNGNIVQYDTPENILKKPVDPFIEEFIGHGRLWKTPEMLKAEDIMNREYVRIGMNRPVTHAIGLMREKNTEVLVVTDRSGNQPNLMRGLVGRRQLLLAQNPDMRMKDIMKTQIVTILPDTPLTEVLRLREQHGLRFIPVVKDEVILGMISEPSILNVLSGIMPESEGF